MAYQKKFTKPFPGGYRDFPDESTIITASVMDNYDQTLEDFDTEFETVDGKLEKLKGVDNLKSAFKFDESGNPVGVEVAGDVVANGVSLIETKEAVSVNEANITKINSSLTSVENRVTSVEKKATDNADEIVRVDGRVDELKSDLANGKKDIAELNDKKITKFYASNLGETNLKDSDNGKIADMLIYCKSEQKQYSGKNLLNSKFKTTTKNGVTCTKNDDRTYTLKGTATANTDFILKGSTSTSDLILFEAGTRLVGCPNGGSSMTYFLRASDNVNYAYTDFGQGKNIEAGIRQIYIRVLNGATVDATFKPMVTTDLTATYDDYEPYVGGIPSPNPDYPQEIKSVVNPKVECEDGYKGTLGNLYNITEYKFLLDTYDIWKDDKYIVLGENVQKYEWNWVGYIDTTLIYENKYRTYLCKRSGEIIDAYIVPISLENYTILKNSSISSKYTLNIPHGKSQATLLYTLNAIPVESGGNVTIDGQQYIADYVDVEKKQIHRFVDSSKLNPTVSIVDNTDLLLSSEEVTDLTDEEVQAFKDMVTYYPTTNVMVTSDQLDGYSTFNYPISMANGWNYVKEQLGDTRDYIYDMELQSAEAYVNSEYAVTLAELEV